MKHHIVNIILTHSLIPMKPQQSLRESRKCFRGHTAAPQLSPPAGIRPYQYFNLLMCNWTDCKCSPRWLELKTSGKPSAPASPHCSTYVAIDQAPVSAGHICAQTSGALIWPTDTDDHVSGGWCRWWMSEFVSVFYFLSFSLQMSGVWSYY